MAQGHKRAPVNAIGCRFDSHSFSFPRSGNEVKHSVECSTNASTIRKLGNGYVLTRTKGLNIRIHVSSAYSAMCGIQREARS